MLLKFPKKKIVLECFTHHAAIHKLFPIAPAKHHLPQWYKKIPQTIKAVDENGVEFPLATFKRCDGFTRLFNTGWVLPLWCDTILETDEDGAWRYRVSESSQENPLPVGVHSEVQLGSSFPNHTHMKLNVPWIVREKTGVPFYFSQNTWGIKEHWDYLTVVPGMINFKHQNAVNINMFLKKGIKIMLEHNTPLVHCIPLSESKLEIKNYLVSDQEYKNLEQPTSFLFSFVGKYKKMLHMKE